MQAQYGILQNCITQAQQLCSELSIIADAALDAYDDQEQQPAVDKALQADLQGLQLQDDTPAGTAAQPPEQHTPVQQAGMMQSDQEQQLQHQHEDVGNLSAVSPSSTSQQPAGDAPSVHAEELLFCVQALHQSLEQQLELMSRVASAVALDMPAEELDTYTTLWELQPYLDAEAMMAALQQLSRP